MRNILLTSAGLTDNHKLLFFRILGKDPCEVKVIYIPTAAIQSDSAREGISICISELMKMGLREENIFTYNLELVLSRDYERTYSAGICDLPMQYRLITEDELLNFDALFIGGGDATFLLSELNRTSFGHVIKKSVDRGLVYIGISAGSMIGGGYFSSGLNFIPNEIKVHSNTMTYSGTVDTDKPIALNNNQAIFIANDMVQVVE